jgi:hypothetical protein
VTVSLVLRARLNLDQNRKTGYAIVALQPGEAARGSADWQSFSTIRE